MNESYSAEQENTGEEDAVENDYGYNVEEGDDEQRDYVDEQAIEDAMQDLNDYYENDTFFESEATLHVVEDDAIVDYSGIVRIVTGFCSGTHDPAAFFVFSTPNVPSLYTTAITKDSDILVSLHRIVCQ